MVTTIQVNERTLLLLKKLKEELQASSYEEAIIKLAVQRATRKSMAGYLGKKYGKLSRKEIMEDLRDKND
ncbi:MAG: hypothetical protein AABX23_02835 [Nanoarchaeota archaeon]